MKIALFHNSYQIRGGEDSMYELEVAALRSAGHEVITYLVNNSSLDSGNKLITNLKTAVNAHHNSASYNAILTFLQNEQPDISHAHNWFPLLSPSIYTAHQKAHIPIVQTLHNYRLGCANATYRREGKDCTLCTPNQNYSAIKHRCYRNSLTATLTWKRIMDHNWKNGTFQNTVTHYIAPSKEVASRHINMGIQRESISIIPNACPDPRPEKYGHSFSKKIQVCFVGRLVHEKGAHILIQAWQKLSSSIRNISQLNIIGEGPEEAKLIQLANEDSSICFYGARAHQQTLKILCQSDLLVCPSIWAEPFGLTVIEAMAAGIGVIASDTGGPADLVENNQTGQLVPPGNSDALAHAIEDLLTEPDKLMRMGLNGRDIYQQHYTPSAHAKNLTHCFEQCIEQQSTTACCS